MNYFSADPHYGHDNIRRYCKRPHATIEAMNEDLIDRWNSVVTDRDDAYILGDFAAWKGNAADPAIYFDRLRGRKHLIIGNHDFEATLKLPWASKQHYLEIKEQGRKICLFHYGLRSWNGMYHRALQLYGHSHGKLPGDSQSLDVGVDSWDYYPVTMAQILARMATLPTCIPKDASAEKAEHDAAVAVSEL